MWCFRFDLFTLRCISLVVITRVHEARGIIVCIMAHFVYDSDVQKYLNRRISQNDRSTISCIPDEKYK